MVIGKAIGTMVNLRRLAATPSLSREELYILLPPLFFRTLERLTEAVPRSSFRKV